MHKPKTREDTRTPEGSIKLQPDYNHDGSGTIPIPYWIDPNTGNVGRQDFWRGNPNQLLGFTSDVNHFEIVVAWHEWVTDPERGTGLLPVFMKRGGGIYTLDHPTRAPEQQETNHG
ncbi:hypothetical protein [Glutamicibacter ardleyensis]|uniref:hypothetical protein n=1 Tax=Glutamicibacter ardleyensis TaxID=225894 RepID=UPI003FD48BDE